MGDSVQTAVDFARTDPTGPQRGSGASSGGWRAEPMVGEQIGKYVVERVIGSGGMGIVVAARHAESGEVVAIKLLNPKAAKDKIQFERFVREARATGRIKSEHVVRVLDAGQQQGSENPFIVMEYLVGRDLGRMLADSGPVPWNIAVDFMLQVLEAVASAHALGIIHRDLKPSNFFVTDRADRMPLVKVLDFGISKAGQGEGIVDPKLTETTAVFGSPTYMSPEQIRSAKHVDARSDIWSLGVALFELMTGRLPFMADNVPGLLASIIADPPFRVTTFVENVPDPLEQVVLACLEKDPARRIGSAAELAMNLRPFASAEAQVLVDRIDRISRGTSSMTSVPPPGMNGFTPHGGIPALTPGMGIPSVSGIPNAGSGRLPASNSSGPPPGTTRRVQSAGSLPPPPRTPSFAPPAQQQQAMKGASPSFAPPPQMGGPGAGHHPSFPPPPRTPSFAPPAQQQQQHQQHQQHQQGGHHPSFAPPPPAPSRPSYAPPPQTQGAASGVAMPVSFGTTGADLAEANAFRPKRKGVLIAIGLSGVAVLVGGIMGISALVGTPPPAEATQPPPPATFVPVPTADPTPPTPSAPASATPAPSGHRKPGKRNGPGGVLSPPQPGTGSSGGKGDPTEGRL